MQLESHATPARNTPEQRYAALHRAIERGMVSDAVWKELAEVSIALGHVEEASRCVESLEDEVVRRALLARMRPVGAPRAANTPRGNAVAPAASDAGNAQRGPRVTGSGDESEAWDELPPLREHVADAVQFLFVQHMPWLSLLTTLAFPLIIGLGGFLTAGASPFGLAAISALPGVCVVAVVCAMGRSILRASSRGAIDPPGLEDVRTLAADAARWCYCAVIVVATLAAPVAAAYALGAEPRFVAVGAVLAAALAPMAFAISQVRGLNVALSPPRLARAVLRGGLSYLGLATVCWAMLVPPALVAWYVLGQPLWVQISAIGPTAVLPVFLVARMLGTWLDTRHHRLGDLLITNPTAQRAVARAQRTARAPANRRRPSGARAAAEAPARSVQRSHPDRQGEPDRQAPRKATRRPTNGRPATRAIEGRSPRPKPVADAPDLRSLPGAYTVSGSARSTSGAAARHP